MQHMRSAAVLKLMNGIHRTAIVASRGRFGWRAEGLPVIDLTTIGRRTGRPHVCLLTTPVKDGETYVVVASRGGSDRHPDWYLNMVEQPVVTISIAGAPVERRRARIATADERRELWPRAVASYPNYEKYQARTTREIPVVLIEPMA